VFVCVLHVLFLYVWYRRPAQSFSLPELNLRWSNHRSPVSVCVCVYLYKLQITFR
jgi:hypothetical protein